MTDTLAEASPVGADVTHILVELGNRRPHYIPVRPGEAATAGTLTPVTRGGIPVENSVSYLNIPQGFDPAGLPLYTMPDVHDDGLFPAPIASALAGIPDGPQKNQTRRMLLDGYLAQGNRGLPEHEAFLAVVHPAGFWNAHSLPEDDPTWVWSNHVGLMDLLAAYYGCPAGRPDGIEDTHWTRHGTNLYPPGAAPDPLHDATAIHTSWGRDSQALAMFAFGWINQVGTATATSATSLTGGTETSSLSHATNDAAGMQITVLTPSGDAGKWAFIKSNTSGTSPVYTVDQWYPVNGPGSAAATTPSATCTYVITIGGAPSLFVALSTDTTTPSLGGASGTADIPAATTAMTGEITTAAGGLKRKIAPLGHTAGAATVTLTPVHTANASDSLPVTVAKECIACSNVAGGGGITYLTLLSTTAVLSASGDALTSSYTMTQS